MWCRCRPKDFDSRIPETDKVSSVIADISAMVSCVLAATRCRAFPAFVINGKQSYGFTTLDALESQFPKSLFATSTATTTKGKK